MAARYAEMADGDENRGALSRWRALNNLQIGPSPPRPMYSLDVDTRGIDLRRL